MISCVLFQTCTQLKKQNIGRSIIMIAAFFINLYRIRGILKGINA